MRRRRRLPPDTRPKWNDPNLMCADSFGGEYTAEEAHSTSKYNMEIYDRLPREYRDFEKYEEGDPEYPSLS